MPKYTANLLGVTGGGGDWGSDKPAGPYNPPGPTPQEYFNQQLSSFTSGHPGFKYTDPQTYATVTDASARQQDLWNQFHRFIVGQAPPPTAPPQFDPAASFNQPVTPGGLPGLNTGGVNPFAIGGGGLNAGGTNPYLSDPLMASYYKTQNPLYANQQQENFYGDPELFNVPTAGG